MVDKGVKLFSRAYKLAALRRMLAGENVSALARELGIRRKYLYQWRERFRAGGPEAIRTRGRPTKAEVLAIQAHAGRAEPDAAVPLVDPEPSDALSRAERRVGELERKVGQQQVELDFFQRALRQVKEIRRPNSGPGTTASTRSSKR